MAKYFYKRNRYDNGGNVATRNPQTDYFDSNVNFEFSPMGSMDFNFNPRIGVGPDKSMTMSSLPKSKFTFGPNISAGIGTDFKKSTNFSMKDKNTGEIVPSIGGDDASSRNYLTAGFRGSLQGPLFGNENLVGGISGETGMSNVTVNRDIYSNKIGGIPSNQPNAYQGEEMIVNRGNPYANVEAGLGYYPRKSNVGAKIFGSYGSEFSASPGFSYGVRGNYGPASVSIMKDNITGPQIKAGVSIPLGAGTRRKYNTGDMSIDYSEGGKTMPNVQQHAKDLKDLLEAQRKQIDTLKNTGKQKFDQGGQTPQGLFAGIENTEAYQNAMDEYNRLKQQTQTAEGVGKFLGMADRGVSSIQSGKSLVTGAMGSGDSEGNTDVKQGMISGLKQGRQVGSIFGVPGQIFGGVAGGMLGAIGAQKNLQANLEQKQEGYDQANIDLAKNEMKNQKGQEKSREYIINLIKEQIESPDKTEPVTTSLETQQQGQMIGAMGMKINGNGNDNLINNMPTDSIYNRQIFVESRYDSDAVSSAGATSIAQIMPSTFKYGLEKGYVPKGTKYEDLATNDNLALQFRDNYMSDLLSRSWNKGTDKIKMAKALAAYNLGPTGLVNILNKSKKTRDIYNNLEWLEDLPKETRDYVNKIMVGGDEDFEKEYKKSYKTYKSGGMTKGEYSHKTNPLSVVDKNGQDTGMELTGGEGVYDEKAQNKIEKALKNKDYAKVGKIVEYEINDWKRRGMYS